MLSAKLIIPKKINELGYASAFGRTFRFLLTFLLIALFSPAFSQDNSPYTRYGLGDIVPNTNINSRAMGGIAAGYSNPYGFSINFSNPASYGSFSAFREAKSKKLVSGRAVLDLGMNIENRTLIDPKVTGKFTTSNALFSHLQVGVPLRTNWGLAFGLRPITRISYNLIDYERDGIDSSVTLNQGDGGAYLASVGTGFKIKKFSFGINSGYMFGRKDYSARKTYINDTVQYNSGNFQTKTNYGNIYLGGGIQYATRLKGDSSYSYGTFITFGAFGNLKQQLNATTDSLRETYFYDPTVGNVRIDSVYERKDSKGKITYPASFTVGFVIQNFPKSEKQPSWTLGVDFNYTKWSDYRFYGLRDSVRNKWELRVGGEIRPSVAAMRKKNYFGQVAYRAGFFIGPDYIQIKEKLPMFGASFGLGLPMRNFNRLNNQFSIINLAFEYIKRGNDNNLLKENMFRISVGFSLSDAWFMKKKYE